MPFLINYNGQILSDTTAVATASNRGFRYGDGIFETMKLIRGAISLESYHFERLFHALKVLRFDVPAGFTPQFIKDHILLLARRNGVQEAARVRINCFRRDGSLFDLADPTPEFVIEAVPLPIHYLSFYDKGLVVDIYPDARKSCDQFSAIKSNNYLPYFMGALFARQHDLDDSLILNARERICDTTISNIFWVRGKRIFTPPLSEGCIAGVMRRNLLGLLPKLGFDITEKPLVSEELYDADEAFLTNALFGVRWIKKFRTREYTNELSRNLYYQLA